jgi:hypothetical protein
MLPVRQEPAEHFGRSEEKRRRSPQLILSARSFPAHREPYVHPLCPGSRHGVDDITGECGDRLNFLDGPKPGSGQLPFETWQASGNEA